jgi:hypothetical protein
MAISIGASVSLFTIIHSVLLRPLPFPDADRLVAIYSQDCRQPESVTARHDLRQRGFPAVVGGSKHHAEYANRDNIHRKTECNYVQHKNWFFIEGFASNQKLASGQSKDAGCA